MASSAATRSTRLTRVHRAANLRCKLASGLADVFRVSRSVAMPVSEARAHPLRRDVVRFIIRAKRSGSQWRIAHLVPKLLFGNARSWQGRVLRIETEFRGRAFPNRSLGTRRRFSLAFH